MTDQVAAISPAVLGGVFALAGTLVAGAIGLLGYWLKARQDLRSALLTRQFERRQEVYERAFELAAAIYQTGSREPTIEDIRTVNRGLILVASPSVLRAWNRIGETSSEKLHAAGMTEGQILDTQTKVARDLYQAIRLDLYPGQSPLEASEMRFIEPKAGLQRNPQ